MPSEDRPKRIALGFHAGGALSLRMAPDKLDQLRGLLTSGESGFREIDTADGAVLVNLGQVIYLRIESDEQRIGF
ncbi:MAG: hypothetical protein WKF94_05170 [Solirubrobacteraceae bacterium]